MKEIKQIEYEFNDKSKEQLKENTIVPDIKVELNSDDEATKEQETQTVFFQRIQSREHVKGMGQRDNVCRIIGIYVNR